MGLPARMARCHLPRLLALKEVRLVLVSVPLT
jgi:hypothetical protein